MCNIIGNSRSAHVSAGSCFIVQPCPATFKMYLDFYYQVDNAKCDSAEVRDRGNVESEDFH